MSDTLTGWFLSHISRFQTIQLINLPQQSSKIFCIVVYPKAIITQSKLFFRKINKAADKFRKKGGFPRRLLCRERVPQYHRQCTPLYDAVYSFMLYAKQFLYVILTSYWLEIYSVQTVRSHSYYIV